MKHISYYVANVLADLQGRGINFVPSDSADHDASEQLERERYFTRFPVPVQVPDRHC